MFKKKMINVDVISGYLDVKISSRSRRGLTPWKAWQKQWCEMKPLESIQHGVEFTLKSSPDGTVLNCVTLPRSATICRTESRTKNYAFGVFSIGKNQKPLLFLSGSSENDSQEWMASIRRLLCIASYLPVGESNFRVSLVDNAHSRTAGLVGLFGVLGSNPQEMYISDPCTGDQKITWKWYQFHQFHLQAPAQPVDDKIIIVMHTSGEFPAGPGQLYLYCKQGSKLLHHLVARGKRPKPSPGLISCKRLSRSEGDICCSSSSNCAATPDSPNCFRSQTGSDDSGVRVSIGSDDSGYVLKSKTASSLVSLGIALLTKTPGGSENNDSVQDLTNLTQEDTTKGCTLPRRESGVSLASGIYEEIPDCLIIETSQHTNNNNTNCHIYENPMDVIDSNIKLGKIIKPPPLPPRRMEFSEEEKSIIPQYAVPFKHRCNTLPAKDLARISQTFIAESDYVDMSPSKTVKKLSLSESLYMPMSPVITLKNKIESCYMSMSGKK